MTTTSLILGGLFLFGFIQTVYSSLLMFSPSFLKGVEAKVWRENYRDDEEVKQGHIYNKYIRGISGFLFGVVIMAIVLFAIL